MILLEALDHEFAAAVIGAQRIRASAGGGVGQVVFRPLVAVLRLGLHGLAVHDQDQRRGHEEGRVDTAEHDLDRGVIECLDVLRRDQAGEEERRALVDRDQALQRIDDVLGADRLAVGEGGVLDQMEGVGLGVRGDLPLLGQQRQDLALRVDGSHALVEVRRRHIFGVVLDLGGIDRAEDLRRGDDDARLGLSERGGEGDCRRHRKAAEPD